MRLIQPVYTAQEKPKGKKCIVFYDDSLSFGGHEIMFLEGLHEVLKEKDIHIIVVCSAFNASLKNHLERLSSNKRNISLYV
ncbi:MAG TPA: hypothetical protein VF857_10170, partial [Spirochaetota bacterium]